MKTMGIILSVPRSLIRTYLPARDTRRPRRLNPQSRTNYVDSDGQLQLYPVSSLETEDPETREYRHEDTSRKIDDSWGLYFRRHARKYVRVSPSETHVAQED